MIKNSIFFIDEKVQGKESLIAAIGDAANWYLIDSSEDGVSQIHKILNSYHDLDSIHIISHGGKGAIEIGSITLNKATLYNYFTQLQEIGSSLNESGDLLIYGCDVAQEIEGQEFITELSKITGIDVAGSENLTGIGGDIKLEYQIGLIESQVIAQASALASLIAESEPNDTIATADAVALGSAMNGQLSTSSDSDWYSFNASGSGTVSIVFDSPISSAYSNYYTVGLYSSGGGLLRQYELGEDKTLNMGAITTAGTYYVKVEDNLYYSSGGYVATVNFTAGSVSNYESESNDTIATADAVALGSAMNGQLSTSSDSDWYSFNASGSGTVSIVFDSPISSAYSNYYTVGLYSSSGGLLRQYELGEDKTLNMGAITTAGTYYVKVEDNLYYSSGGYVATVNFTAGSVSNYESESNDTIATADAVTLGSAMNGQLSTSSDSDWYSFNASGSGTVSIVFDSPISSAYSNYYTVGLYSSGGGLLRQYELGEDKTLNMGAITTAGTYYVKVEDNLYYSSGGYVATVNFTAGSVSNYESESNDTIATADAVTLGSAMNGQLSTSSDSDWYSFNASGSGTVSIVFDSPISSAYSNYYTVGLYSSGGGLLRQYELGEDKTLNMGAITTAGTYYVKVEDNLYYSSGGYVATVNFTAGSVSNYESESNDTIATADAVALGSAMNGQLSTSSDSDWYSFNASGSGTVSIVFDSPISSAYSNYYTVGLYSSSGGLLRQYELGEDKTLNMGAITTAGTYYVKVEDNLYYSSGGYVATVNFTAGSVSNYESESNDTIATADAVTLGSAMNGQLSTSSDSDWYSFNASGSGTVSIVFDSPISSAYSNYYTVGLYSSGGGLLRQYELGEDKTLNMGAITTAGTYYVKVEDNLYYSSGGYVATVNFTAGSVSNYESESNDTIATADAVTLGSAMNGQLSTSSDSDWYTFTTDKSGILDITFDSPTNSRYADYFKLSVFDEQNNLLAQHTSGSDLVFQVALAQSSSCYVRVTSSDYYYNSEQYSLTLSKPLEGNSGLEQEPNDYYANALTSGVIKRGQVATIDDEDWFYIRAETKSELSIMFDAPTDSTYADYFNVRVFDEKGNLLASRATGKDINFSVNAPDSGNYFIEILSGDYYYDSSQYSLIVSSNASTINRESEPNNSFEAANTINYGASIYGQLATKNDIDRYSIVVASSGQLTINFDGATNSTYLNYFQLSVHDSLGNLLYFRDTGSDTVFDINLSAAGKYYVSVNASSYYFNADEYSLTVTALIDEEIPYDAIVGTVNGDFIEGTADTDLIFGLGGNDLIDGGDGIDTVVFSSDLENLSINSIDGLTAIRGNYAAGDYAYSVSRLWNIEKLKTWSGFETLEVRDLRPLFGSAQSDYIIGTADNDLIDGLGGNDFVDGNDGDDKLALFGSKENFTVQTLSGITRINCIEDKLEYSGFSISAINIETLAFNQSQIRALETNSLNKIFGTTKSDLLTGTSSDDVFDGQGGSDRIDGGAGQDTLVFFGKSSDFKITLPSGSNDSISIVGKAGTEYTDYNLIAKNIEIINFLDQSIEIKNQANLSLLPSTTYIAEGGNSANLQISLSVEPVSTVTVKISNDNQLVSSISSLTFDSKNWKTPQSLNISAFDDAITEQQHVGSLTLTVDSVDIRYKNIANQNLNFIISDNDAKNTGSVSGRLWNDFDKDKILDPNETPLVNWLVFDDSNKNGKWDSNELFVKTDVSGVYRIDGLSVGSHVIVAKTENGWMPTYPSGGSSSATVITNNANFGEVKVGELTSTSVSQAVAQSTYENLGTATNIASFHADPRFSNINGQGYSVVIIDTGIDLNHSYFGSDSNSDGVVDRIVYQYDFSGANDSNASDKDGHGTHVAGIVGSSNTTYPGIAPNVNLIVLKVFSDNSESASSADIAEAANWVVQNSSKYNIVAVNLSLGDDEFNKIPIQSYLSSQFKSLANNGVIVVSASGNGYEENQVQGVSYPSSDPYSLSVGAVWSNNGSMGNYQTGTTDAIAYFSQRDDTESDIFAPGVFIDSADSDGSHVMMSGTSMASPMIAGMVALSQQLAEQELGRRLTYDEIRSLLKSTGDPIIDGDNENDVVVNTGLTFYRVDMMAMAEAIVKMKQTPLISHTVNVTAGTVSTGKNFGFAPTQNVQALSSDDLIVGSSYGEAMRGGDGNDFINAGDGDDLIYGEAGDDNISGGLGADKLDGGLNNDILNGDEGNDFLFGGEGNDTVVAGAGSDLIIGGDGAGDDNYDGGIGRDTIKYTSSLDDITVNLADGSATSSAGGDTAGIGTDVLTGIENVIAGYHNDLITGSADKNSILGEEGNDTILSGEGRDYLNGGEGNDYLDGGLGIDLMIGGSGDDIYVVDTLRDVIIDQSGWDTIKSENLNEINLQRYRGIEAAEYTGTGAVTLIGSQSNNSLIGGTGADTLSGKFGNDILTGGDSADSFVFNAKLDAQFNFDQITDFTIGVDKVVLDKSIFTRFSNAVQDSNLVMGMDAQDSDDYLIYDSNTQTLYYDADGNAFGAKVAFVQFVGINSLNSGDFLVI